MRVLMLSQFYAPVLGGEERIVQDMSVALARRGHSVAVGTLWHEGLPRFEVDEGVRVHRIQGTVQRFDGLFAECERRHPPPFPDPETTRSFLALVRRERPDVIHAHNWIVHSIAPFRRLLGAPLLLSLHDHSLVCATKRLAHHGQSPCSGPRLTKCLACAHTQYGAVKGLVTTLALRPAGAAARLAVDMLLPVSRFVAEQSGLPSSGRPYAVLPNFLPDRLYEDQGTTHVVPGLPTPGYLLFVGDLMKDKGVEALLEAHAGVRDAPPLVLIGRPYSPAVRELPRNVFVLGPRPHAEVMEAWRRCSIGVVPSICREAFGLVALEGMAAGRPVIAARSGGLPEVLGDESGVLVAPGDISRLRDAIGALLADPARRERLGAAARRRSLTFSETAVVTRLEAIYRGLAGRRCPTGSRPGSADAPERTRPGELGPA